MTQRIRSITLPRLILPCLLTLVLQTTNTQAATQYRDQVFAKTLPNGLEMVLLPDHKAPVAVIQVWYRVGSRNEVPGKTGLSHMLEHMMFKGTERHAAEEYSRIIARQGGNENAFTSADATTYFAKLAADRMDILLELEADRMRGLSLRADEFEPERKVVAEERRMRVDDDPISYLRESLAATAYAIHPYRQPVIGWSQDIENWTLADLQTHYDRFYQPGNAVIVAVGDFEPEKLAERIEHFFGPIPAGPAAPAMIIREEPPRGPRRIEVTRPAKLPFVILSYPAPNLSNPDYAALEMLSVILSAGKSSRMQESMVREQQVALYAGASYHPTSVDDRTFTLAAQAQPETTAIEVEAALVAEVEKVRNAPPTQEEMQRARRQIESSFVFSQDSVFSRAMLLGHYAMAGDWQAVDAYLSAIEAVTPAEVQKAAQQWLDPQKRTTGVLHPEEPSPTSGDVS